MIQNIISACTQSDIVTFGYNRDGKRGHEQMVIALLCSAEGCPVGVEGPSVL